MGIIQEAKPIFIIQTYEFCTQPKILIADAKYQHAKKKQANSALQHKSSANNGQVDSLLV